MYRRYQQRLLLHWIDHGLKKSEMPNLPLILEEIGLRVLHQREQARRRKKRLQRFLSTYRQLVDALARYRYGCG